MQLRVYGALLIALNAGAQGLQPAPGLNLNSIEKEAALGAQLAQNMGQKTTVIESVAIRDYVEGIGRQLAAQLPNLPFTYTFTVIADDIGGHTHEPLPLPAGYIFVPAGLILAAQNETEFAGMLAHAMAHVAERHSLRQAVGIVQTKGASIPLVFISGWMAMGSGDGDYAAVPMSFLTISREFEIEADVLAIKMMVGAAYDPEALVQYISRVQPEDTDASKIFSALPSRASRIAAMEQAIHDLPTKSYIAADEFYRVQAELRRLLPNQVRQPPSLLRPNENT